MIKLPIKRISCAAVVGIDSKGTRVKAGRPVRRLFYQSRREMRGTWISMVAADVVRTG